MSVAERTPPAEICPHLFYIFPGWELSSGPTRSRRRRSTGTCGRRCGPTTAISSWTGTSPSVAARASLYAPGAPRLQAEPHRGRELSQIPGHWLPRASSCFWWRLGASLLPRRELGWDGGAGVLVFSGLGLGRSSGVVRSVCPCVRLVLLSLGTTSSQITASPPGARSLSLLRKDGDPG